MDIIPLRRYVADGEPGKTKRASGKKNKSAGLLDRGDDRDEPHHDHDGDLLGEWRVVRVGSLRLVAVAPRPRFSVCDARARTAHCRFGSALLLCVVWYVILELTLLL